MHQQSQNVTIDATPEKVWKVVADENRLGEWSDGWRRHNFPWTKRNKVLECNKEPAYCLKLLPEVENRGQAIVLELAQMGVEADPRRNWN